MSETIDTTIQYSAEGYSSILKMGRRDPLGDDFWYADLRRDGSCALTVVIDGTAYDYQDLCRVVRSQKDGK